MQTGGRHLLWLLVMVALVAAVMKREPARTDEMANEPAAVTEPTPIPEVHLVAQTPPELKAGVLSVDGIELGTPSEKIVGTGPPEFRFRVLERGPRGIFCPTEREPDPKKPELLGFGVASCGMNFYTQVQVVPREGAVWVEGESLGINDKCLIEMHIDDVPPLPAYWQNLGPLTPDVNAALKKYGSERTLIHLHYPDIGLTATFPSDRYDNLQFRLER